MEAFKKNIVEDIKTSDINKLLVKTCIDLVSMENISWQEIAGRIFLGNIYKQASKNRNIPVEKLYSPESYLALVKEYNERGFYSEKILATYSEDEILEVGQAIVAETDTIYGYNTVLLSKRYLLNPNKVVKELPQGDVYVRSTVSCDSRTKREPSRICKKSIWTVFDSEDFSSNSNTHECTH